jgi:beta-lactamase superfamily II metal-dependent hydrolase
MSKLPLPNLTIVDVGHGNAAVLEDTNGVVVFDSGRGQRLRRYLRQRGLTRIKRLLLSHADADHCTGAISLLHDPDFEIGEVYQNPDVSKRDNVSFKQLLLALAEARRTRRTSVEPQLSTSLTGKLDCGEIRIEVMHPPPELALAAVNGYDGKGNVITSNSLSGVVRLSRSGVPVVLLAGDIEFSCLEYWRNEGSDVSARVLIFPHHGGLPGNAGGDDAGTFAAALADVVKPNIVVFSIHRTLYELPRTEVTEALEKNSGIQFICTQVPDQIKQRVCSDDPGPWARHRESSGGSFACREGHISILISEGACEIGIDNMFQSL